MSLFIKNIFLVQLCLILAILYPTSLANLVVEVGTRHSHQTLLNLETKILTHTRLDGTHSWTPDDKTHVQKSSFCIVATVCRSVHLTILCISRVDDIHSLTYAIGHCWQALHSRSFDHNSNSMEISFCFYPISNEAISTTCCTRHDNCAVFAYAKVCYDMATRDWVTAKWIFHRIQIVRKISFVNGFLFQRKKCSDSLRF